MVRATLERLSSLVTAPTNSTANAKTLWEEFTNNTIWTFISGEKPNPTDSGYLMVRLARQVLEIPEERFVEHGAIIDCLSNSKNLNIIFFDDIVGSGSQCVRTWFRPIPQAAANFSELAKDPRCRMFYLPLIATEHGKKTIERFCPKLTVLPVHTLGIEYNLFAKDCAYWPVELRADAEAVVKRISRRVGIPDSNGSETTDWKGFGELGLTLAFQHCVPDATIPLIYWTHDWNPLIRRS
jgi:hypothetical protein